MAEAKLFSWNWKDALKATIMLFLTTFVAAVYQSIEAGAFPTWVQIKASLIMGGLSAIGYLLKNFLTNSNDQFATKEQPK